MNALLRKIAEYTLTLHKFEYPLIPAGTNTIDALRRDIQELYVIPTLADATGTLFNAKDAIEKYIRIVVLGAPGAGKTTLLRFYAATFAQNFLNGEDERCPLFFRASELASDSDMHLEIRLARSISKNIYEPSQDDNLIRFLNEGKVILLIDAIDEIAEPSKRFKFISDMHRIARLFPQLKILVSSRPAGLTTPLYDFAYFNIEPFDISHINSLVHHLSMDKTEQAERFIYTIQSHRPFLALASSPLLLNLLWQIFQSRGRLPENLTSLYSDFTDFLLSTWERSKGIKRARVSLKLKHLALEQIAYEILIARAKTDIKPSDLKAYLHKFLIEYNEPIDTIDSLLNELLSTGILLEQSYDSISFIHLTFLEYFSACALSNNPEKVLSLVERPELHNVVVMVCGILSDVGPIIEAAVEKRHILLAAKCISYGRTRNKRLAEYVISSFIHEVGEGFISNVIESISSNQNETQPVSIHDYLLSVLDRTSDEGLSSNDKGRLFEDFSCRFFGEMFKVVRRDYNTENGEIDLVLELIRTEPFWADFGGEMMVECKNWSTSIPLKEVGSFSNKVAHVRGVRLGFFISVSGFTEDALRTLQNQASNITMPLIVPISGQDLRDALLKRDDLVEFLKDQVRKMKWQQKD